jgi:hypothetical protein
VDLRERYAFCFAIFRHTIVQVGSASENLDTSRKARAQPWDSGFASESIGQMADTVWSFVMKYGLLRSHQSA